MSVSVTIAAAAVPMTTETSVARSEVPSVFVSARKAAALRHWSRNVPRRAPSAFGASASAKSRPSGQRAKAMR
jgi:hypothetical protein